MKTLRGTLLIPTCLLLLVLLLTGCGALSPGGESGLFGNGFFRRTIVGTSSKTLTSDRFWVKAGQSIVIDYEVTVRNGDLYVSVGEYGLPSGDSIERVPVRESGSGRIKVPINRSGNYRVRVSLWGFGGDLHIRWGVKD